MVRDSRASELVNSFSPTAANYDKVISGLKNRFGKDELLVEVYVRELLELVLNNATLFKKYTIADVSKDQLTKLMEFLQAEVENEERIALAVGRFGTSSDKSKTKEERRFEKRGKSDSDAEIPTAAELAALKENKAVTCIFCSGSYNIVIYDADTIKSARGVVGDTF